MLKLIHAADFHLDAPFAALPPERAAERREEQRQLLTRLAELAEAERADLVLLSGDLLDSDQARYETVQALARALVRAGHTVTVNFPSPLLDYDPMDYDLLVFGGSVYMGEVARPLKDYLSSLRFRGRQVLLFAVGDLDRSPELASLRLCVPAGNQVRSIKVKPGEAALLCQFALG